jgi:outer membrane lipoprotein-sorting protein
VGAVLTGATMVHARSEPGELLIASELADQRLSYSGTKVIRAYKPGEATPTMERRVRVWHRAPDQTRVEVVSPADRTGMVMLDTGSDSWMFSPRHQRWRPVPHRSSHARPELLLRNYIVEIAGKTRIAGRHAFMLRVIARRPGNPSKTVWVDSKTKVPLKQELFDLEGRLLVASEFREIQIEPSIPANLFTVPVEARQPLPKPGSLALRPGVAEVGGEQRVAGIQFVPPRYVPPGYVLVVRMRYHRPGFAFAHYRYSDGLNTISLFQERRSGNGERREGPRELAQAGAAGALPWRPGDRSKTRDGRRNGRSFPIRDEATTGSVSCGNRLIIMRGDTRYILVGNISATQLQRMADSIPEPAPVVAGRK